MVLRGFLLLFLLRQLNAAGRYSGGEDDLRLGVAVLLQVADEGVKLHGAWESNFQHDGVHSGDAVAFKDIWTVGDKRIEFILLFRVQCQIIDIRIGGSQALPDQRLRGSL